ncbi:MAG TPA: Zn-dependent hydrolase [Alphaproteobacteria bacterium]|jgi:N-carbamoyl-L-amino-acid hydrolase
MPAPTNLTINGRRLWDSLMELAKIGATEKGGVCRLALTDLDRQARDLFVGWCKAAGATVSVDRLGNIFARREGRDPARAPVMTGSHIDTQPTGGKFDGAYGVMAGLEVLRTLHETGIETEAPIEVAVWTNEEGARFAPAVMGSGVFAGVFKEDEIKAKTDREGVTFGAALMQIGYSGALPVGGRRIGAFFECHIEQGPILEADGKTIGVVTGGQAQRWYEVTLTGQESHAGTTPMERRRDALLGAARVIDMVNHVGVTHMPAARATCGVIESHPQSRNTVPGRVFLTVEFRHPDEAELRDMDATFRAQAARIAGEIGLTLDIQEIWHFPMTPFHPDCVAGVREAAQARGYPHRDIISGAGHDALYMARVAPTAMVFVPCADGISHNEIEDAKADDLAAGCQVLLDAMIRRANAPA